MESKLDAATGCGDGRPLVGGGTGRLSVVPARPCLLREKGIRDGAVAGRPLPGPPRAARVDGQSGGRRTRSLSRRDTPPDRSWHCPGTRHEGPIRQSPRIRGISLRLSYGRKLSGDGRDQRATHTWFDAFRTLKFVHAAREEFPDTPLLHTLERLYGGSRTAARTPARLNALLRADEARMRVRKGLG